MHHILNVKVFCKHKKIPKLQNSTGVHKHSTLSHFLPNYNQPVFHKHKVTLFPTHSPPLRPLLTTHTLNPKKVSWVSNSKPQPQTLQQNSLMLSPDRDINPSQRLYHSTNSSTPAPYVYDTDTSPSDPHRRIRILKHPYSRVLRCSTHNSNRHPLATNSRLVSPTEVLMQVSLCFHSSLLI